jgi:hypothetical protein
MIYLSMNRKPTRISRYAWTRRIRIRSAVGYQTDVTALPAIYSSPQDYVIYLGQTLNFAPGETVKTVRVTLTGWMPLRKRLKNFSLDLLSSPSANATIAEACGTRHHYRQ